MTGQPLTRTTSADGNWVYTLYDGASGVPFVHALSTVDKYTVCIDLDALEGRRDVAALRLGLRPRDHTLAVAAAHGSVALINTDTFEVATPPAPRAPEGQASGDASGIPWLAIGAFALVIMALASLLMRRRLSAGLRVRG
jgi:hypothetical protein